MCGILALLNSGDGAHDMRAKVLALSKLQRHRGPDWSGVHQEGNCCLAHERLAIIDPDSGDQPLYNADKSIVVAANGEIYNHKELKAQLLAKHPDRKFHTASDCEVIAHLYEEYGEGVAAMLDGMFSFVLLDKRDGTIYAARDPIGITSLYIGWGADGSLWVSSELKCLAPECPTFQQFPPGHYYTSKKQQQGAAPSAAAANGGGMDGGGSSTSGFIRYYSPSFYLDAEASPPRTPGNPYHPEQLRQALVAAVEKRMMSDVPFGVLLSGGLDSSLVAAIAARAAAGKGQKLLSFCIGLEGSPDLKAAQQVADAIGTQHTGFTFSVQEGIDAIEDVIWHIETYDVTTIRASTPMFLMSRKIKALGVKMVLSGEGSDEVFGGYLYFHKAPNKEELFLETVRKVKALHLYDCLRANKSTMAWGLEARVPFLDRNFLEVAMNIDPAEKMIDTAKGRIEKYILRKAFDTPQDPYLPDGVLWRQKEQFSDGVGYSWIDGLKAHAEALVSDQEMAVAKHRFPDNTPTSKEAYWYRCIFESHFPHAAAVETVPGGPSIACSTAAALAWDEAWSKQADPSGRAIAGVHEAAYQPNTAAAANSSAANGSTANGSDCVASNALKGRDQQKPAAAGAAAAGGKAAAAAAGGGGGSGGLLGAGAAAAR